MAFGYSPVSVVLLLTSPLSVLRKGQPGLLVFVFTSRFNGCLVPALARGSVSQVGRVMGADPMSRSSCSSLSSPLLGAVVKKRASDDWSADGAKADQSVRPNHNPREDRRDDSRGLPNEELLPSRDSSRRELVERIAAVYVQVVPQEACHREQALPSENASSLGSGKGGSEVRGRTRSRGTLGKPEFTVRIAVCTEVRGRARSRGTSGKSGGFAVEKSSSLASRRHRCEVSRRLSA